MFEDLCLVVVISVQHPLGDRFSHSAECSCILTRTLPAKNDNTEQHFSSCISPPRLLHTATGQSAPHPDSSVPAPAAFFHVLKIQDPTFFFLQYN